MQFWQHKNWIRNICNTSVYYIESNSKYSCPVKSLSKRFIDRSDLNGKMNKKFR